MDEIAKAQQNEVSAKIDLKLLQSFRLETVNYFVILYASTGQRRDNRCSARLCRSFCAENHRYRSSVTRQASRDYSHYTISIKFSSELLKKTWHFSLSSINYRQDKFLNRSQVKVHKCHIH